MDVFKTAPVLIVAVVHKCTKHRHTVYIHIISVDLMKANGQQNVLDKSLIKGTMLGPYSSSDHVSMSRQSSKNCRPTAVPAYIYRQIDKMQQKQKGTYKMKNKK